MTSATISMCNSKQVCYTAPDVGVSLAALRLALPLCMSLRLSTILFCWCLFLLPCPHLLHAFSCNLVYLTLRATSPCCLTYQFPVTTKVCPRSLCKQGIPLVYRFRMYTHTNTHMHAYMHACTHALMHACMHAHMHTRLWSHLQLKV